MARVQDTNINTYLFHDDEDYHDTKTITWTKVRIFCLLNILYANIGSTGDLMLHVIFQKNFISSSLSIGLQIFIVDLLQTKKLKETKMLI
jgi:hypothetical protein